MGTIKAKRVCSWIGCGVRRKRTLRFGAFEDLQGKTMPSLGITETRVVHVVNKGEVKNSIFDTGVPGVFAGARVGRCCSVEGSRQAMLMDVSTQ